MYVYDQCMGVVYMTNVWGSVCGQCMGVVYMTNVWG